MYSIKLDIFQLKIQFNPFPIRLIYVNLDQITTNKELINQVRPQIIDSIQRKKIEITTFL